MRDAEEKLVSLRLDAIKDFIRISDILTTPEKFNAIPRYRGSSTADTRALISLVGYATILEKLLHLPV